MDLRKIKKLIELLGDSALVEMEITEGENTIRLSRASSNGGARAAPISVAAPAPVAAAPAAAPAAGDAASSPAAEPAGEVITSPMVGTFYPSSSPDASPYVTVGSVVSVGDTLCIIEAMKTFNQFDAEIAGTVREIYMQSGDPVEFGEPLFRIEP